MCTSCNQNTMTLIPELESMFRQNGRRISDEISSGINSYGGYQQEYETGQPKAVPKSSPGLGTSTNCITPATRIIPKLLDPKLIGCVIHKGVYQTCQRISETSYKCKSGSKLDQKGYFRCFDSVSGNEINGRIVAFYSSASR